MESKTKKYIIGIAIPLAVGGLSALLTQSAMQKFNSLNQPPLAPPSWLFPVVWTVLLVLMGIASSLVYMADVPQEQKKSALTLYGVQLAMNFLWSIVFFNFGAYLFAFVWLLALLAVIIATAVKFRKISEPAAWMLIPYIIWVCFAGYLNFAIYLLN